MGRSLSVSLEAVLSPGQVLSGAAISRTYDCDAYTVDKSPPTAIVLPESTEEVSKVVKWCMANGVPFTARGAGTGLSGGAMPAMGGVVVSTKRMAKILEIDADNRRLRAQTGAVNRRLSDAAAAFGLHFAPDPSSQSVCTLGGNIAENSGGPHTLKYGVTSSHVLGLTLVDSGGDVIELRAGEPGYDLVGLVVGSEGTLGIVAEATVKLTPLPKSVQTMITAFPNVRQASEAVSGIIAQGILPAALEMMDAGILNALRVAFDLEIPAGAQAMLLVECDGEPDAARTELAEAIEVCRKCGATDVRVAKDEAERAKIWTARKKGIGAMGRLAPTIVTHDGVIPRSKLPETLDFVYEVAARRGLKVANLFHAGDGNLHPCFYFDDREPGKIEQVVAAGDEILKWCVELGGSITGEHGVGVEKVDLMSMMFSPEAIEIQRKIPRIFNRNDLCNPCKVIPNQKGCVEHKRRWRGAAT